MYIEGNLHGDGEALGRYIMSAKEGELVELAAVRGFATDDLYAALGDVELEANQTECEYAFFHAYLRAAPGEHLTNEQWLESGERYLDRLGLAEQPYVASFHIDEETGEKHLHMAVSRIEYDREADKFFAIDPGLYKVKGCDLARELEEEFGLRRVSSERQHKTPAPSRDEYEESKRLGTDVRAIRDTIRDCLDHSDNGQSFMAALEQQGFKLANGDRRDCFVVIDQEGGHHALNKKLTGMKLADIRARLADIEREQLPSVEQAKEMQAERRMLETENALQQSTARPKPTLEDERAAAAQITEPAAPLFDRDAAERQWMEQLAEAAIAYDRNREHRAAPEAVREFAGAVPEQKKPERPLNRNEGKVHLDYTHSDSARGFTEALEERGLRLSRVSAEDVTRNEAMRAGYRQYAHDHPEEAKAYGIKEPPRLREGELVVVALYKDEPRLCFLTERTTGDTRQEIQKFLGALHEANLPDIKGAAHDLREAAARQWQEKLTERPLAKTAGEIRFSYTLSDSPQGFTEGLDERGLRLARVHLRDVHQNEYEREQSAERGLRPPAELQLGEFVVVNRYGSVFALNERITGDSREEIAQYLSAIARDLPSVFEARQDTMRTFTPDPEIFEKRPYELRELRTELTVERRELKRQLENEDLLPTERAALDERQETNREQQTQLRAALWEKYVSQPAEIFRADSALEWMTATAREGISFGQLGAAQDILRESESFLRDAGAIGGAALGLTAAFADTTVKLFEAVISFFDTPSLPTPEVIHAVREGQEHAAEARQADAKADREEDDRQRRAAEILRQMEESEKQYKRLRDQEPGREREHERAWWER